MVNIHRDAVPKTACHSDSCYTKYAHWERMLRVLEAQTPNTRNQDTNKIAQYCIDPYWILGKTCNHKGPSQLDSIQTKVKNSGKNERSYMIYHERSLPTYKSQGYY